MQIVETKVYNNVYDKYYTAKAIQMTKKEKDTIERLIEITQER